MALDRDQFGKGAVGGSFGDWTDAGTNLTATVSGLTAGSHYLFEVRAANTAGAGPGRVVSMGAVAGFTLADYGRNRFGIRANPVSSLSIGSMKLVLTGPRGHSEHPSI